METGKQASKLEYRYCDYTAENCRDNEGKCTILEELVIGHFKSAKALIQVMVLSMCLPPSKLN